MSAGAAEVLAQARDMLERTGRSTAGLWPRAAAVLGRQALEAALDELWLARCPGLERCSARAQLLCLSDFVGREAATRASWTWAVLSRACHHHPYELPPTAPELRALLDEVEALIEAIGGAVAAAVAHDR